MPTSVKAIILGLLTALVGLVASVLPQVSRLEAELGLDALFILRGPRPAPADVVVVSIDRESSDRLGLPNQPDKWPRSLHARLVRSLRDAGAQVVVFDIVFAEARDADQDREFAQAVREAGNVVLFEYLTWYSRTIVGPDGSPLSQVIIESRVPPIPELAQAAAALAPFPLPKMPNKVNQFWLFKTGAGDVPTLPVVAFHVLPFYDDLLRLLQELPAEEVARLPGGTAALRPENGAAALARTLRRLFQAEPALARRLHARLQDPATIPNARIRAMLARLIEIHSGDDARYLDFYGPPRTITTIPYYQVLEELPQPAVDAAPAAFQDKAVFVGFSEQLRPEQKDGFHTVFSQPDGADLSGVEIAATAFANLLEGRSVRPLDPPVHALVIVVWGAAVSALLLLLHAAAIVPSAGVLAVAYVAAVDYAFGRDGTWLPFVVPLLVQLPQALLSALLWRHLDTRRERQRMREAFGHYLPGRVIDELIHSNEGMAARGQLVYGICLATDAERYTTLSETLGPDELRSLLNRYYETLFEPVKRRGGLVSDVVGDAMLALWVGTTADPRLREQACQAALDIVAALDDARQRALGERLPTRIGLHCGELLLGNIGAGDHYEYRAVGDIVNTATRIEGLNKVLGTRALTSREMIEGLDGLVTRELGSFRLAGKTRPLVIHELVCPPAEELDAARRERHAQFAAALGVFRAQRWQEATAAFQALLARYGDDGPSRYYLRLCERYARKPPSMPWDGVVALERK